MKNDVFISYEHNSKAIADTIVAAFEKEKIRCWYAPRDVIGDYATSIVEAIDNSSVFVLILNGEASNSMHVLNEVEMAYMRNIESNNAITIVPFRVNNDQLSRAMEYYVKRMHWIDATTISLDAAVADLTTKVKKALGINDVIPQAPPEQRTQNKYFSSDDKKEIRRLKIQSRLLKNFDGEIYKALLNDISSLKILDLGCNMGDNIYDRVGDLGNLSKLIGIDCEEKAIAVAKEKYGSDRFGFYVADIESNDFEDRLRDICDAEDIEKFDAINISMLILHLKKPSALLKTLRHFLAAGGILIIRDIDDGFNVAYPDPEKMIATMVQICSESKYSGYRQSGREIFTMLKDTGYKDITLEKVGLSTVSLDYDEREALFNTYFGFIPEDIKRLTDENPSSKEFGEKLNWINANFEKVQDLFMKDDFFFSLGFMLFTAKK